MATFNLNTPNIPDEADILTQVRQIRSYITNLNNQLRYDLSNIDEDNLTGGELPENAISRGFRQKVLDLQGNMSVFEQTATSFGTRITNAEGDISTINQTVSGISSTVSSHTGQISAIDQKADNISLAVSQEKVWRAATENALNTALSAAGITKAAGLLWYDTTNNVVKRWTGTAWANTFVNTSQIVIDDDSIDIGTTGTLNMQAGGNLNVQSGGNLNVLNGGDIEVSNGGDINVASGGKINVSAADLIISGETVETYASDKISLSVSSIQVGGRNLIKNSDWSQGIADTTADKGWARYYCNVSQTSDTVPYLWTWEGKPTTRITVPAGTEGYIYQDAVVQVNTATPYILSVIIRWNATLRTEYGSGRIINAQRFDSAGNSLGANSIYAANTPYTGNYQRLELPFTAEAGTRSIRVFLRVTASGTIDNFINFQHVQLEQGNKATPWKLAEEDPASGVKTSYIDIASDHIDIATGGNITMSAGALMKLLAAVVQIDASDAANSYINFGNAFNVGKGDDGNFALTINSPTDNAIMVNNRPVWHKGNIRVQQNQPASGSGVLWMKPITTSQVIYAATITSKSSSTYSGGGYKEYSLANQNTDVMSAAGTYSFSLNFTLRHYGDGNYTVSQITITLTKGGKTLTLYTGSVTVGGWSSKVVAATGTTTDTDFTSGTGVINCKIQPSGTIPYTTSDFLAHEVGTSITATITGPGGGGSAQLCEVKYVP